MLLDEWYKRICSVRGETLATRSARTLQWGDKQQLMNSLHFVLRNFDGNIPDSVDQLMTHDVMYKAGIQYDSSTKIIKSVTVCGRCFDQSRNKRKPTWCREMINFGEVPEQLKVLTPYEQELIGMVRPLVSKAKGGGGNIIPKVTYST